MSICVLPWIEYHVGPDKSGCCCYRSSDSYESFHGAWDGNDMWNSDSMMSLRKSMLSGDSVCSKQRCNVLHYKKTMSFVDGYLKYCKPSEELKRRIDQAEFAIENGDTFLSYYPLSLDFSFGYKCNGRCPMCSIGTDRSYQSLQPAREQYEFLDNLVSNCFLYRITGGEFFCLSDYEKDLCLRSVRRDVTLTSLYTNGVLLTIDNYEKYCVEGPIDKVHVSIDTVNEVAYGILRGMDLNQVKKNLADISMKYPYHKIASINCVISAFSYPGVFDFVQYAKEIGVKNVMFTQMSPYNLSKHNLGHLDVISTSMNEDTVVKFDALVSKCKEYSKKTGVMVYGLDEALQSMILNVYDK